MTQFGLGTNEIWPLTVKAQLLSYFFKKFGSISSDFHCSHMYLWGITWPYTTNSSYTHHLHNESIKVQLPLRMTYDPKTFTFSSSEQVYWFFKSFQNMFSKVKRDLDFPKPFIHVPRSLILKMLVPNEVSIQHASKVTHQNVLQALFRHKEHRLNSSSCPDMHQQCKLYMIQFTA